MIVLHIDSSASGSASASRQLSAAAVETLRAGNENVQVKYRDVAANPPAHLSGELLSALRPSPGNPSEPGTNIAAELTLTETLIDELLQADVLVLGAPMYNFSIPSPLKAWIDRVAQPGRTFRYTDKGPVGLAGGKKALIISSRGGAIAGTPMEAAAGSSGGLPQDRDAVHRDHRREAGASRGSEPGSRNEKAGDRARPGRAETARGSICVKGKPSWKVLS